MMRDAPILILDEPTSSLDAAAEALTLEALERLRRDARRLSAPPAAAQTVVLESGRIVEHGTHDEFGGLRGTLSAVCWSYNSAPWSWVTHMRGTRDAAAASGSRWTGSRAVGAVPARDDVDCVRKVIEHAHRRD